MRGAALVLCCGLLACSVSPQPQEPWIEPVTGMTFVRVAAGQFLMGSPATERGRESQEVAHRVTISRAFWLGAHEVTQAQWQRVMGSNPSTFPGETRPVEQVSWNDVTRFLQRLSAVSPHSRYRLPTEAEWEFACRAGSSEAYGSLTVLNAGDANVSRSPQGVALEGRGTTAVASFRPNAWGFYDMHGNVWEWTADAHCPYPAEDVVDPVGTCGSPLKVIRGGSWYFAADSARCALRYTHPPDERGFSLGLRLVREPLPEP